MTSRNEVELPSLTELNEQHETPISFKVPPDGGRVAWLVALAIFGINLGQGGYLVAWGTFQVFYEDSLLKGSSASVIAWIGSIQYALDYTPVSLEATTLT
ncbi:hypothetical protein BT96DRAFT_999548 [Gymnopus androsaceus JB14]|uniref:Major facilitator superfamily (MFS) profile domain-containing protein n=1 Tax=Gymnopus androsaceus JB14 TaxID=1447944 RepID=A0A6A4H6G0_9AGAR|nr:hypothetical protein BT96DRAFT_999548 [Gymnopus androsaceus JB14]